MNPASPDPTPGTRERLLDTAEMLFAERGFEGTSVRQITDAAGANLGAVNYHFRSKENLYAEVFTRRVALLRDPLLTAAERAAGISRAKPEEALLDVGRAFLAPLQDRAASLRVLGLFARETIEACLPPGLLGRELVEPMIDAVTVIVRRIRPDLPEVIARACAHSFNAQLLFIAKGAGRSGAPVDGQLDHAVRFSVAAIRHIDPGPRKSNRCTRLEHKPS